MRIANGFKVIEITPAYECGWIDYSNIVSLREALEIKRKADEWRKSQGVKTVSYHIWDRSKEDFQTFITRVKE